MFVLKPWPASDNGLNITVQLAGVGAGRYDRII